MANPTGSTLNANAAPFQPDPDRKCLFLTFSNGFPVTYEEVRNLFESMYPGEVRSVYVNIPGHNAGPKELWGKVVFTKPSIPDDLFSSCPSHTLYPREKHPMVFKRFDSNQANNNNPGGAPPPPQ